MITHACGARQDGVSPYSAPCFRAGSRNAMPREETLAEHALAEQLPAAHGSAAVALPIDFRDKHDRLAAGR